MIPYLLQMGHHWGGTGGMWGFGLLWSLLWLLAVTAVVGVLFTMLVRHRDDRAMAVLRERYARGEISDEEFEERTARLGET